jgi:hypothetical protein
MSSGPITLMHGAAINVSSDNTNGGDISISAREGPVKLLDGGRITARAAKTGGNVIINAGEIALSRRSLITGEAGLNGGSITLTTRATALGGNSLINGKAVGMDVDVDVFGRLLQSIDSAIQSDNATFTLDTDLASALVPFGADIAGVTARLQDFCGIRVSEISSFTVTGRGGLTLDPARAAPASPAAPAAPPAPAARRE